MINYEKLKSEILNLQAEIIKPMTYLSKLSLSLNDSEINKAMDELMLSLETACIKARAIIEEYRPIIPMGNIKNDIAIFEKVYGYIEVTNEGWLHIKLNTLLPHCRFTGTEYFEDSIRRLLKDFIDNGGTLPKFENAFIAIEEFCNHTNRNAFDQDNKGWKVIPNALKGLVFDDDDQFHLSIGLFAVLSDEVACHIYVVPSCDIPDFTYWRQENLYLLGIEV